MADQRIISDDWSKNWQASIAIKITALVLWAIIVVVFFASSIFLSDMKQRLESSYSDKADQIIYQVVKKLQSDGRPSDVDVESFLGGIIDRYDLTGIRVDVQGRQLSSGSIDDKTTVMRRALELVHSGVGPVDVEIYHPELDVTVLTQRNRLVMVSFIVLLVFGLFLTWVIRTIVHRPLQLLVNATQAVSEGCQDARLDTKSEDEFGHLSRFFNKMLDRLMDQQNELQLAVDSAQAASRAKSAFLANMSHELRTPLNAIIGYSEMLKEDADAQGVSACIPDLKRIHSAGTHLLSMINNVLDLSKIEAGKISLSLCHFSIATLIEDVVNTVQPTLRRNGNRLIIEGTERSGEMYSDESKLRQSLINLLGNAAKFTDKGVVTLSVWREAEAGTEWICFSVHDTGIGIPQDQIARLFTDFTQVDSSTTRKYGGTGLGLAISRRLCQRLGGDISVVSELGMGSTFVIRVPDRYSLQQGDE